MVVEHSPVKIQLKVSLIILYSNHKFFYYSNLIINSFIILIFKVDRSGAYAARWVAKSLVKAGLCKRCLFQVSYAIGISEPISLFISTYGTGTKTDEELLKIIRNNFDLKPGKIIR